MTKGNEREEVGNAEAKKAIISQHQDAMTVADRQGELQLIAALSSSLCTSSPPAFSCHNFSTYAEREQTATLQHVCGRTCLLLHCGCVYLFLCSRLLFLCECVQLL